MKIGDIITVNMGQRPLTVRVLGVSEHATKDSACENYEVIG